MTKNRKIEEEKNTAWLLAGWAYWIQDGGINLKAKSAMISIVPQKPKARIKWVDISDEEAAAVDAALAKMGVVNEDWLNIIWLTFCFVESENISWVAREMKMSRYMVGVTYEEAYCWIDEFLTRQNQNAKLPFETIELFTN